MKFLTLLITLQATTAFGVSNYPELDLVQIRSDYPKAAVDKKACRLMIDELSKQNGGAVFLAYLGAYKAIWANHTINPISKLSTFEKGKKDIEAAVKLEPNNIEIRFIRLSIQKNCPSFLGYRKHIESDLKFIDGNKNSVSSPQLKKMIADIIKRP